MRRFCRNMPCNAVIKSMRVDLMQNCRRRCDNKAIKYDGNFFHARCKNSTHHGCYFTTAKTTHNFKRIVEMILMKFDCLLHRRNLASVIIALGTRARPCPLFGLSAKESQRNCRSNCCIADSHFAQTQQIGTTGN